MPRLGSLRCWCPRPGLLRAFLALVASLPAAPRAEEPQIELDQFSGVVLFDGATPRHLVPSVPAEWEALLLSEKAPEANVTAEVVTPGDQNRFGCDTVGAGNIAGKVVLLERGNCNFAAKAQTVQDAGGVGVLIYDSVETTVVKLMGLARPGRPPSIPAFLISRAEGLSLRARLLAASSPGPAASLVRRPLVLRVPAAGPPRATGTLGLRNGGGATVTASAEASLFWYDSEEPAAFYTAVHAGAPLPAGLSVPGFAWPADGGVTPIPGFDVTQASSGPLSLPFSFPFFGAPVETLRVSSRGFLALNPNYVPSSLDAVPRLPSAGSPNGLVAPYWGDLRCDPGRGCSISAGPGAAAAPVPPGCGSGGQSFAVRWIGIESAQHAAATGTFAARLHSEGCIEFMFAAFPGQADWATIDSGLDALDAWQGVELTEDLPFASGAPFAALLIPRFSPLQPRSGTALAPGAAAALGVAAAGPGSRQGWLKVTARDASGSSRAERRTRVVQFAPTAAWRLGPWGICRRPTCAHALVGQQSRTAACTTEDGSVEPAGSCRNCTDSIAGWTDANGLTCSDYRALLYCTATGGVGMGWSPNFGAFEDYASSGATATQVCCVCGGGAEGPSAPTGSRACSGAEAGPDEDGDGVDDCSQETPPCSVASLLGTTAQAAQVPDSAASSSSTSANCSVPRSRLGSPSGAWCPAPGDQSPWLQWDLGGAQEVRGVTTRGWPGAGQWVTSYRLAYSVDGSSWVDHPTLFAGSADAESARENSVVPWVLARYVRARPLTWRGYPSLRLDLSGCSTNGTVASTSTSSAASTTSTPTATATAGSGWDTSLPPTSTVTTTAAVTSNSTSTAGVANQTSLVATPTGLTTTSTSEPALPTGGAAPQGTSTSTTASAPAWSTTGGAVVVTPTSTTTRTTTRSGPQPVPNSTSTARTTAQPGLQQVPNSTNATPSTTLASTQSPTVTAVSTATTTAFPASSNTLWVGTTTTTATRSTLPPPTSSSRQHQAPAATSTATAPPAATSADAGGGTAASTLTSAEAARTTTAPSPSSSSPSMPGHAAGGLWAAAAYAAGTEDEAQDASRLLVVEGSVVMVGSFEMPTNLTAAARTWMSHTLSVDEDTVVILQAAVTPLSLPKPSSGRRMQEPPLNDLGLRRLASFRAAAVHIVFWVLLAGGVGSAAVTSASSVEGTLETMRALRDNPEVFEPRLLEAVLAGSGPLAPKAALSLRATPALLSRQQARLASGPWGRCLPSSCSCNSTRTIRPPSAAAAWQCREVWCAARDGAVHLEDALCAGLPPLAAERACPLEEATPCPSALPSAPPGDDAATEPEDAPARTGAAAGPEGCQAGRARLPSSLCGPGPLVVASVSFPTLLVGLAVAWACRRRRRCRPRVVASHEDPAAGCPAEAPPGTSAPAAAAGDVLAGAAG